MRGKSDFSVIGICKYIIAQQLPNGGLGPNGGSLCMGHFSGMTVYIKQNVYNSMNCMPACANPICGEKYGFHHLQLWHEWEEKCFSIAIEATADVDGCRRKGPKYLKKMQESGMLQGKHARKDMEGTCAWVPSPSGAIGIIVFGRCQRVPFKCKPGELSYNKVPYPVSFLGF